MDVNTKNRSELKAYFVKNSIPTEGNFVDMIDGMLNQKEDGLVKQVNNALSLEAVGDDDSQKNVLKLYYNFSDSAPDWQVSLNPRSDPNDASTAQRGLSLSDGAAISRLFIDHTTGHIGLGTISPSSRLTVEGSGPQLAEFRQQVPAGADASIKIRGSRNANTSANIASIDLANFDQNEGTDGTDYTLARISGGMADDAGQTGYLRFYTNDGTNLTEQMRLDKNGKLGIGTTTPQATLDVNGSIRGNHGQNSTSYFGLAAIGQTGYDGWAGFAHKDRTSAGNYALLQDSAGKTYLNAASGQNIHLNINNQTKFFLQNDGKVGIGTSTPQDTLTVGGTIRTTDNLIKDKKTTPRLNAGWYRIAQSPSNGGSNAGIFEIRWTTSGRHGHIRFAVGANFGADSGSQITVLDRSSYSYNVVRKIRLWLGNSGDAHYIEFLYQRGSASGASDVPFEIYQYSGYGWSLIDPTPSPDSMESQYSAYELPATGLFATRSGASDTSLFVVDNGGQVGIGTASPGVKLDIQGGNLKLGAGGTPLQRIVAGTVSASGSRTRGSGFSSSQNDGGVYDITFSPSFTNPPIIVAHCATNNSCFIFGDADESQARLFISNNYGSLRSESFHFIAIGV